MSKIYDKYLELKAENKENTLYLFKNGIFFIFIDKDAMIASNYLHLKLGQLNDTIVKCGFPVNSMNKYLNLLKNSPYKVEIFKMESNKTFASNDYMYYENIKPIIDEILKIDVNSLSISQAFEFITNIQNRLHSLNMEYANEKEK